MSNIITVPEHVVSVFGVEARAFNVVFADKGKGHILNQQIKATRYFREGGKAHRITVSLRFDDQCKNGHEDFSITGDIYVEHNGRYQADMGGCIHEEIAKHFPELKHLIKWHLTSTDGPMHYIANTVYHAGDRDSSGLRKGEVRQIKNGRTGEPCWVLEAVSPGEDAVKDSASKKYSERETVPMYILKDDAQGDCPAKAPELRWVPWNRVGEGSERNFNYARDSAVWPDATEEQLSLEPDELKKLLEARLPALKAAFKRDMLAVGFVWPEWLEVKS